MIKGLKYLASMFVLACFPAIAFGNAFFETGTANVTTTVDSNGWVTVTTQKTYHSPVVVAGTISHNNNNSLSVRVRNVGANSFQIGMQSACESYDEFNSTSPRAANTCPPAAGWQAETIQWMVVERGTWRFPDGTKIEAYLWDSNKLRATGDTISFSHTFAAAPTVLHTVNTFNDAGWITSSVWSPLLTNSPPTTTAFNLALEGAEATNSHGSETIGWVAIERGTGTNLGHNYSSGRTGGLNVDRHSDECQNLAYGINLGTNANVIAHHNSMNGANGGWIRSCGAGVGATSFNVHIDEDQVNDSEQNGIEEYAAWFGFPNGQFGELEFIRATKSATESGDNVVGPGEIITYDVTLTNTQNDFAQANNTGPEFVDVIDANLEFVSVGAPSSGSLAPNAGLSQIEWTGAIPSSGVVTFSYQLRVRDLAAACTVATIINQGTVLMDPIDNSLEPADTDSVNVIDEVTDDALTVVGDSDNDGLINDDDPTRVAVDCRSDIQVSKDDGEVNYTPNSAETYTLTVSNAGPHNLVGATVNDVIPDGLTLNGAVMCAVTVGTGSCGTQTITGQNISQLINLQVGAEIEITIPVMYSVDPSDY